MAPGPTPTLTMSAPAADEVARAVGGDDVAGRDRDPPAGARRVGVAGGDDQGQGLEHLLLMAVGGVDHEDVDAGGEQRLGLGPDVAVDADGSADRQASVGVDRGRVDGRAQRAGAGDHAGQHAAVEHGRDRDVRARQRVEVLPRFEPGLDREQLVAHDLAHLGEPVDVGAVALGDDAHGLAVVDDDRGAVGALGEQAHRLADGHRRRHGHRRLVHGVRGLDPGDGGRHDVGGDVLRDDRDAAAPGDGLGHAPARHGRHVGHDDRDRGAGAV